MQLSLRIRWLLKMINFTLYLISLAVFHRLVLGRFAWHHTVECGVYHPMTTGQNN